MLTGVGRAIAGVTSRGAAREERKAEEGQERLEGHGDGEACLVCVRKKGENGGSERTGGILAQTVGQQDRQLRRCRRRGLVSQRLP